MTSHGPLPPRKILNRRFLTNIDTQDIFGTAKTKMIVPMTIEERVGKNHKTMIYYPFHTDSGF